MIQDLLRQEQSVKKDLYTKFVACGVPNFSTPNSSIFIYTDVIKHQIISTHYTQMLKSVVTEGVFGEVFDIKYSNPQYKQVVERKIQEIEVQIRNDQGEFIDFQHGKVMLVLHFRRIK